MGQENAWDQLGTPLPAGLTAIQAMRKGKLARWNIRKLPLQFTTETGQAVVIPDRYAIVRDSPTVKGQIDFLGDVGSWKETWQNEDLCVMLDAIAEESGATFSSAGEMDGGQRVFVVMRLPGHLKVCDDKVEQYLALVSGHDGGLSHTFMATPVRVSGAATLNAMFRGQDGIVKFRQTGKSHKAFLDQSRHLLDMSLGYLEAFRTEAESLAKQSISQPQFERLIFREFGPADDASLATVTRCENKIEQMVTLYAGQESKTAWSAFGALTEWHDHQSPTRGDDRENARAIKAVLDPSFKNRALRMVKGHK